MKPLTIEQLKSLEVGDWVWIVNGTLHTYRMKLRHSDTEFIVSNIKTKLNYSNYGKTWLAYKNKEQAECKGREYMNKQEQIEAMRMIVFNNYDSHTAAQELYNAGYGDTKQAVKEFAERLKDKISLLRFCDVATTEHEWYMDALADVTYDIDELVKEYEK